MPFFFRPNVWKWWTRILGSGVLAAATGVLLVHAGADKESCAAYPVLIYLLTYEILAWFEYDCQAYSLYEYPNELACLSQEDILKAFEGPQGTCGSCLCGYQVKMYYISREHMFNYAMKDPSKRGEYLDKLESNGRLPMVAVRRIGVPAKTV